MGTTRRLDSGTTALPVWIQGGMVGHTPGSRIRERTGETRRNTARPAYATRTTGKPVKHGRTKIGGALSVIGRIFKRTQRAIEDSLSSPLENHTAIVESVRMRAEASLALADHYLSHRTTEPLKLVEKQQRAAVAVLYSAPTTT